MQSWWSGSRGEKRVADPRDTVYGYLLVIVLAAALLVRLYRLNAGLWLDEILTYVNYARMPFGQIVSTYTSENQNLLYSVLAHASFKVFGESAWSLRLPAVLFGVGSVWALYLFGRQVGDAREALLSASLLAFSYHHVWFSQNARGYTGLLFWTLVSSWLFLRGLDGRRPRFWILYAAAVALGIYTHLTMLFVVVGHLVIYAIALATRRKEDWSNRWAGLFLGFCVAGLLTLLLHAPVLPQMLRTVGGTEKSVVTAWKNPIWTVLEIIRGLQVTFLSGAVGLVAILLFGVGLISYARTNSRVILLLVIPPVIGAAVTLGIGHHLWPRFFFFAIGFGTIVLIRGVLVAGQLLAQAIGIRPERSALVGTILCVGLILVSAVSVRFAYGPKQDYGGALSYVESARKPEDAVVAVGLASNVYEQFYDVVWPKVASVETLEAIRSRSERTWLLYTFSPVLESVSPAIMESIRQDFRVIKEFRGTVASGTVFVCLSD